MKWPPKTPKYCDIQGGLSLIKSTSLIICGILRSYTGGRTWFFFFCGIVQGQGLKGRQLIHHKESNTGAVFKHFFICNFLWSFAWGGQVSMAHKSIRDQCFAFLFSAFPRISGRWKGWDWVKVNVKGGLDRVLSEVIHKSRKISERMNLRLRLLGNYTHKKMN